MRVSFIKFFILLFIGASPANAQPTRHVVLITIDGLRPEFYMEPGWGMVNLNMFSREGAYATGVNSVFPSATLPAHTTLVTGVNPSKHGIYYNSPFSPERTSDEWYWYFKAITSPTLWDIANNAGLRTASVNWPVTVGAPIHYNVPVIKKKGLTQLEVTIPHITPAGLFEKIEMDATGKLTNTDFAIEGDFLAQDQTMARIGAFLIREYKPHFITIHLSAVDHFEHKEGRDGIMVRRAVSGVDRDLRTIIESIERAGIKNNTTVIVTGDHGHVKSETLLAPNVWLSDAGLITDLKNGQWKAQFKTAGGAAFLHLKDSSDITTLKRVKELLTALPQKDRNRFRVIDKATLIKAGGDPHAVLALSATSGNAFSAALTGEVMQPASGSTHGHIPDFRDIQTGFVAFGPGIQKGKIIREMNLTDIAPTIAFLLGVDLKTGDGKVIKSILE